MNLKGIRDAIFAQADWAPTQSPEALVRVNRYINRAYNQISLEAPFLFFEAILKFATQPDAAPTLATDTISIITATDTSLPTTSRNPWVFQVNLATGTTGAVVWPTDRSWDGRMIEIEVNGVTYRNRIRAVWKVNVIGGDGVDRRFTVEKPWDYAKLGYGPYAKWRVYTEAYYLPDDVISVKSARLFLGGENWPLKVASQGEAEDLSFMDKRDVTSHGTPRTMYRRPHFQMPAPTGAAVLTPNRTFPGSLVWHGPEPPGQFQYVFTYCWGKRDMQFRNPNGAYWGGYAEDVLNEETTGTGFSPTTNASHRMREPLWESAPSPASSAEAVAITLTGGPSGEDPAAAAIDVSFPNIDYMQGFFTTGTKHAATAFDRSNVPQSGWYIRIYRKRITADFTNYSALGAAANTQRIHGAADLKNIESPSAYYLLTELNIDELNDGNWIDRGEVIPDYSRRLRDVHGYQGIGLYPYPGKRYEVDVRCVRRPQELEDDQDVPLVHAEACEAIIARALVYLRESEGTTDLAMAAMAQYERAMSNLTKRYGSLLPSSRLVNRKMTRARPGRRRHGNYRRWYTLE